MGRVDDIGNGGLELLRQIVEVYAAGGVLVDLDIHGFSMFTKRVSWVELGIPAGDARSKQFTSS